MGGKLFLISALALFFAGCAGDLEISDPETRTEVSETISAVPKLNLDEAVFNEVSGVWMVPQPDPYTLENFQKAYDNLAAGRSKQELSKAERGEFAGSKRLEATHYALKIYPRSEEEQWKVEMMEDVQVVYIPFDFVRLPQAEAEKMTHKRSTATKFAERSPYTVTYENDGATDGGPTGLVTYQLPILYTVWPVEKPLPEDLEYIVDYEVFLPRAAAAQTKSAEALFVLEQEAVSAALGVPPVKIAKTRASYGPDTSPIQRGRIRTRDDMENRIVPMANLKLTAQLGSLFSNAYTDAEGYYEFPDHLVGWGWFLNLTYQDHAGRWKITGDSNTAPYQTGLGPYPLMNPALWTPDYVESMELPYNYYRVNEIYRAVHYYYNDQNVFPKHYPSGGLKIIAHNYADTPYFLFQSKDIYIFNRGDCGRIIGDVLHEIGHLAHYMSDGDSYYTATPKLLRESLACYVGWYVGEVYYKSVGWLKPVNWIEDFTHYQQQDWRKTDSIYDDGHYSPLFIDLTDNYNQSRDDANCPDEEMEGVPASAIWSLARNSDWGSLKGELFGYGDDTYGMYFSSYDLMLYLQHYDYWFAHNPIQY